MAREGTTILDSGDRFPDLTLSLVGGGTLTLPGALGPGYGVALFYRAHW
jgi:vacuolar-type H+-ATPase catalytic subunit A/Vma1